MSSATPRPNRRRRRRAQTTGPSITATFLDLVPPPGPVAIGGTTFMHPLPERAPSAANPHAADALRRRRGARFGTIRRRRRAR
jgi:hypothetical protein